MRQLTMEEKKQEILAALARGIKGSEIEPTRRGATVSDLRKGKPLAEKTIDKLYDGLLKVQEQGQSERQVMDAHADLESNEIGKLREEIARLQSENDRLQSKIKEMERMEQSPAQVQEQTAQVQEQTAQVQEQTAIQVIVAKMEVIERKLAQMEQKLEQNNGKIEQSACSSVQAPVPTVLGFRIVQKTTKTKGKSYRKWYASKGAAVVYLGNDPDPSKAESKIRAYCQERGIEPTDTTDGVMLD